MKKEHESVLERIEMGMFTWMYSTSLREKKTNVISFDLLNQLNIYVFVMHGMHFKTLMHKLFTIWHMFFSEDVPKHIFFSIWANQGDLKNQYL